MKSFGITYKVYTTTLDSNANVSPYSYYKTFTIPTEDVNEYGIPIGVGVNASGGIPVPNTLYYQDNAYKISIIAPNASVTITVKYIAI